MVNGTSSFFKKDKSGKLEDADKSPVKAGESVFCETHWKKFGNDVKLKDIIGVKTDNRKSKK